MPHHVRLIGPVQHESEPQADGCFFVLPADGLFRGDELGWFFPFIDSAPVDPLAHWHVLAGFASKEAAEERRREWLNHDGVHAVDSKEVFHAIAELCRLAGRRMYLRIKKKQRKKAERKPSPTSRDPGLN